MPLPLIGAIIGGIVELGRTVGGGILERSKLKAKGKIEVKKAKIRSQIKRWDRLADMDVEGMKGMAFSWKDEYILVLMSIPLILAFVPGLEPHVKQSFEIINNLPEWYRWSWMGIVTATYGLRTWTGWKK
jgi:hypothetical protein